MKVVAFKLAGAIASLKVTVALVVIEAPVALFEGSMLRTVGGVTSITDIVLKFHE
jgi:hypothetical protein